MPLVHPAARPAIVSGDRADGTQQRLTHGLGEFRPYRWRGKPGWNPATAIRGWRSTDRRRRPCPRCGAKPGHPCLNRSGNPASTTHTGR